MKKYTYVDENNNTTVAANYQDAAVKLYGQGKSHSGSITTYAKRHRGYASAGGYFQTVKTSNGRIPVITGNSVRGILRDTAAKHLLEKIGEKVNKEVFNVLFSGGSITAGMKPDLERARQVREHFPIISVLGGGLGTMMMSGKLMSGFLYPLCDETAEMLHEECNGISWRNLIDEIELTRMNDAKNDKNTRYMDNAEECSKNGESNTQMRYSVQYMAAGTVFVQQIQLADGVTDIELGALYNAFAEWFKAPHIGGMSARGFGTFDAVLGDNDIVLSGGNITTSERVQQLIDDYNSFIDSDNTAQWLSILTVK